MSIQSCFLRAILRIKGILGFSNTGIRNVERRRREGERVGMSFGHHLKGKFLVIQNLMSVCV